MLCELNEVNDHLYIGSARSVTNTSLSLKGITCIINCSLLSPSYSVQKVKYIPIMIEDNERENIACYFDEVANIIHDEHVAGGKTLVYCVAGISRSATLCIAYLMKFGNMTLRNAFRYLRSRRQMVRPNNGFFRQLIDYERRLYSQTSVQMIRVPNADSPDCVVPDVFYEVCKGIVWLKSCKNLLKK
ncbi:dual specificity protein phosphatase 14-like [Stegodyphus dumicola]|uniref:dual specificity protein phosphatase 14-like n=1 Tax=Stegodyphus dumicola TaxID=202533 RepID=UPI0015AC7A19|nr:dual specificity protein phosphatase 14-like [Stegodyphus dumicola]XP_035209050.1 dual specificity protein phosphatase 14-like [Stegodyphus dumicola]